MDKNNEILKLKKQIERLKNSVKKQKYGLVWMDVPEAFEDDVENKLPILKEVPELAIKNNDGKPQHILIEGDNYHALTCLNYTHKGKIDVIYIDPPYNTGSDGFRYKDKRIIDKFPDGTEVPKDHPFRHSYWLSFMRKRLELARDLLKISGLIMISIDINEIAQLKLLCDEIFSEKNLVANIVWRKTNSPKAQAVGLGNQHEYILIYAKDFSKIKINKRIGEITESYTKMFSQDDKDGRGKYRTIEIEAHGIQNNEKRNRFKFRGRTAPWLYSIKTLENWWNEGKISVSKNGRYRKKEYLSEIKGRLISDLWTDEEIKPLQGSSSEYVNFLTQKPISLIKRAIKLYEPNKGIVLDFFAGSGTTASTVLGLNKDKDFDYQCIICTNNEENICLDYCYPRIKKDLQKFGNSLKYYKTDFIGKNNILDASDEDKVELAHNAGELLALAENTLELVKKNKYYQLFKDNLKEKYTAVYFREELDQFDKFADMVKKLDKETVVYVFSWGQEEFIEEFEDLKNVNVKTIPVPILEIYKNIYNLIT